MTKILLAAALAVAATASVASATTLTKLGGMVPEGRRDLGWWDHCALADGTSLEAVRSQIQDGVFELSLEHRASDGTLKTPPFSLALGAIEGWGIVCDQDGSALVHWRLQDQGCERFRLVDADHRHAGEIRDSPAEALCKGPVFSLWQNGFTVLWRVGPTDTYGDLRLQAFDRSGAALYAPLDLTDNPQQWRSPELATDAEGNTLVAWEQGDATTDTILAVAARSDGEPSGEPIRVFDDDLSVLDSHGSKVVASAPGLFSVVLGSQAAGGLVAQHLAIAEVATQTTTTSTTTSTTTEDDPALVFGHEIGLEGAADLDRPGGGPRLATDGAGRWLATWTATSGTSPWNRQTWTLASTSADSGRRWSKPLSVEGRPLAILDDGAGQWIGIGSYYYANNGYWIGHQIHMVRGSADGSSWELPRPIAAVPEPEDDDCYNEVSAVAAGRSRGGVLAVVWAQTTSCDFQDTSSQRTDLYVIRSTDRGETWSEPSTIGFPDSSADVQDLKLIATGGSGWVLVLRRNGTEAMRSEDDGVTWIDAGPWPAPASPVCDSSGHCVMAFESGGGDFGGDGDIFAVSSIDAGQTWSEGVPVNGDARIDAGEDTNPTLATDDHGRWTAVWVSHRNLGGRIGLDADLLEAVSVDGGKTWSPPRAVSDAAATDGWMVDDFPVLLYGDGAWVAAWERSSPSHDDWVYDRHRETRVIVADDGAGNGVVDGFEQCDDGNLVDGDGCDSNGYFTACGNGITTAGEECDDGNTDDDDACTSGCRLAVCGDGFVEAGVEQCDDANSDGADACTNDCTLARCGDGVVARGLEECDDGNTIDEDACPTTCRVARCGDGFVEDGVEECDDANSDQTDGCVDCRVARCGDGHVWLGVENCDPADPVTGAGCPADCGFPACGDANGDGLLTVTDSMRILAHSVGGSNPPCPMQNCDLDGNLWISSRDALVSLGLSVGLPYQANCSGGAWITIRLQDDRPLGALQIRADTSAAPVTFPVHGNNDPGCESMVPESLVAAHMDGKDLVLGLITSRSVRGPVDVARCRVEVTGDVHPSQFAVSVENSTDGDGNELQPPPRVVLRAVGE